MNSKKNSSKQKWIVKHNTLFLDIVRITGAIPAMIWKRPKVHYVGDKKKCLVKGGVLIASNHVTFTDPILLYCVYWRRRLRFLATKDLYKNAIVSFLFSAVGCIQVDKENFNINTLHETVDNLKSGKAILIFPEGEVNQTDQTLSFKSGAVLMSQLSGAPIQPVYIVRPEKWYHRNVVLVGEPIDVKSMCGLIPTVAEIERISEHIRSCEEDLKRYYLRLKKSDSNGEE